VPLRRDRTTAVGAAVLVAAAMVGALAGCGPRSARSHWKPGDTHATPADAGARATALLTLEQARTRLDRAVAESDAFAIVVYGNAVLAKGGEADVDFSGAVDRLDRDTLASAWGELDATQRPAARVALRMALVARHSGDDDGALEWAARVSGDAALEQQAAEVREEVTARRAVDVDTVAVLLPLSGAHEAVGREIEAGIELAAAAGDARVVFVDTAGEEAGAAAAVDQAVYRHHAVAILGPVGQREARAAAARAAELGIPIALLAPGAGGGAPDAGVFRLWPSGGWVAAAAAREAARRGFDRLAVFAPRDEYGKSQLEAFRAAASAAGARVVASAYYDPTATDLEPDVKELLGLDPKANERLRKHLRKHPKDGWKTFSPDVGFDLLFVPDEYSRAALVVAFLPFFNVELRTTAFVDTVALERKHGGRIPSLVQLMGSPGWHHPGVIARGGRSVEGALVADVCAGGDAEEFSSDGAAAFFAQFQRRHGRAPTPAAAQAFDAARLVLAARAGAADRADFTARLLAARLEDGACGPASVASDGEIERQIVVLRIDGGEFMVDDD